MTDESGEGHRTQRCTRERHSSFSNLAIRLDLRASSDLGDSLVGGSADHMKVLSIAEPHGHVPTQ